MTIRASWRQLFAAVGVSAVLLFDGSGDVVAAGELAPGVAATVNGQLIGTVELNFFITEFARQRFYHGAIPPDQRAALRNEVIERLIGSRLLAEEANRRGIPADTAAAEETLKQYLAKLPGDAARRAFEPSLPKLREQLLEESKVTRLESRIREVAKPSEAELRQYYRRNLNSFTEPMRERLSLILIGVEAGSPSEDWTKAEATAKALRAEILGGADFAAIARKHSTDRTASEGGDMGYLHRGMLGGVAEELIAKLQPGEVSQPVMLLEGYGVFRLVERVPERLHTLDEPEARQRAQDFYRREKSDQQWQAFTAALRTKADVRISQNVAGQ
jgi:peptidylprolyl isomerase